MPGMLRELSTDPDSGMLGYHLLFGSGGPYVVQYWSSVDKLYAYASSPNQEHRPAWTAFNRAARKVPGAVGVWHETFRVDNRRERVRLDEADGAAEGDGTRRGAAASGPGAGAVRRGADGGAAFGERRAIVRRSNLDPLPAHSTEELGGPGRSGLRRRKNRTIPRTTKNTIARITTSTTTLMRRPHQLNIDPVIFSRSSGKAERGR